VGCPRRPGTVAGVTKPLDRENMLTAMAGELNRVALQSAALGELEAATKVGFQALRFARMGADDAPHIETKRRAMLQLALAHIWIDGPLGPLETLTNFRATRPNPESLFSAFEALQKTRQGFESIRRAGTDRQASRLQELEEAFAAATFDAYLSVPGGTNEDRKTVLDVFLQHPGGLYATLDKTEIWHKCQAAGLNRADTETALAGLLAAGVLRNPNKFGSPKDQSVEIDRSRYGPTLAIIQVVRAMPGSQRDAPTLGV
jgi:hypothetical protein